MEGENSCRYFLAPGRTIFIGSVNDSLLGEAFGVTIQLSNTVVKSAVSSIFCGVLLQDPSSSHGKKPMYRTMICRVKCIYDATKSYLQQHNHK